MVEPLYPWADGSFSGPWPAVGGDSFADVSDLPDDDTAYVEGNDVAVSDYFDVRFDPLYGSAFPAGNMTLRYRARNSGVRGIVFRVRVYDGNPAAQPTPTVLLDTGNVAIDGTWATYSTFDTWNNVKEKASDFGTVYARCEISALTGAPGAAVAEVSLLEIETPLIGWSAASPERVEPEFGKKYNIHLFPAGDGPPVRKVTAGPHPVTGEGRWFDRDGVMITEPVRDFVVPE